MRKEEAMIIFLKIFASLMAVRLAWDIIDDFGKSAWREPFAYVIAAIPFAMMLLAIWWKT